MIKPIRRHEWPELAPPDLMAQIKAHYEVKQPAYATQRREWSALHPLHEVRHD